VSFDGRFKYNARLKISIHSIVLSAAKSLTRLTSIGEVVCGGLLQGTLLLPMLEQYISRSSVDVGSVGDTLLAGHYSLLWRARWGGCDRYAVYKMYRSFRRETGVFFPDITIDSFTLDNSFQTAPSAQK
jgi:hypothetical protein